MDRGVTPSAPCGHQTKGPTVFNLPVGWFKQNTSQISRFPSLSPLIASISHCSQHSSHQILSLSHVNYCPHTSSSLPPSLPSLSLTCQKWWRERSVSRGLPSPGRAPARSDDLIRLSGHERHASPRLAHHTVYVSCQLSVSSIVAGRWLSGAIAIRAYKPSSS